MLQPSVPMTVVYDIFNRINTGGTKLERQEIRNCIFIGKATTLLKQLAQSSIFKNAIDYGITPTRMKDREAILRCLAFFIFDYQVDYNNSMDDFLERAMKRINAMSEIQVAELESTFDRVMRTTIDFFGKRDFRLPTGASRGRINIALMECVYNFFAINSNDYLVNNREEIIRRYNVLLTKNDFVESVKYSTGATGRVKNRFSISRNILGGLTNA